MQGWYNGKESWQAKLSWGREQNLGGIGIWVLDGKDDPPVRWELPELVHGSGVTEPGQPAGCGGCLRAQLNVEETRRRPVSTAIDPETPEKVFRR